MGVGVEGIAGSDVVKQGGQRDRSLLLIGTVIAYELVPPQAIRTLSLC